MVAMLKYILSGITILVLATGCSKEPTYIHTVEKVYMPIPEHLLTDDIKIPHLVNKEVFVTATPMEQNNILINTILNLYGVVALYKIKLKSIVTYDNNMSKK